ncbi:hypothetical protein [Actinacidiphila glaucinigra]|uniref:hypothetical protein n=1 Tax=Actinacidiphila glaucinigra TaxID=235986 RepID=UPI002E2FF041|nr:hypothetical protein [Actinacidiphila glaucinigra]
MGAVRTDVRCRSRAAAGSSSFQAGSLAVSLPLIDTIEPIGAVLAGADRLNERLATSGHLAVQVLGAALAVTGIVILDRSPLVRT